MLRQNVTILGFTISGPGPGPCGSLHYGVRVDSSGSANILGNHITEIRDNPFSGCQNGVAVRVGRFVDGTTGSAKIIGNVIDNYQKNGPTVDNEGSYAEIAHNRVLGVGPTPLIGQNGIQVQVWATWILYAVLIDLRDAVAEALGRPADAISVEMVYRGLYHFTQAYHRGEAADLVGVVELWNLGGRPKLHVAALPDGPLRAVAGTQEIRVVCRELRPGVPLDGPNLLLRRTPRLQSA